MPRVAPRIELNPEEQNELTRLTRAGSAEQRFVLRARIVLLAAEGLSNQAIAVRVGCCEPVAGKWRTRFAQARMVGLQDAARPGKPARYDAETERRVAAAARRLCALERPRAVRASRQRE